MPREFENAVVRIGHAVCALPEKFRDPLIDQILVAFTAAQTDSETTEYERSRLPQLRQRMLSAIADSPLRVQLDHNDELVAIAKRDRAKRAESRENLFSKRHKKAYMAQAERTYVPPTKT